MTTKFAFTFEFSVEKPETLRGEVTAASLPSCMRIAAKLALKAFPHRQWSSCVLVLDRSGYPDVLAGGEELQDEEKDGSEDLEAQRAKNEE
jgi:hypothetical protein